MLRRVVIGIVLAIVGLSSVLDIRIFTALIAVIGCGSLLELRVIAKRSCASMYVPIAACGVLAYYISAMCGSLGRYEGSIIATTVLAALTTAIVHERREFLLRSAATLFAVIYVGKLLSYFITIRTIAGTGYAFTVFAIFIVAFTDIFAMLIGKRFGRTQLTEISPAKTVEGAAGALVVAIATGIAFVAVYVPFGLDLWQGALLAAITSIAAQVGDAVESGLKRDAALKDAGSVLPGHGGVLDRFDSYLFGGIAFYTTLAIFGRV